MLMTVDCETVGYDTSKMICGTCVLYYNYKKVIKTFFNKNDMYDYIIKCGIKFAKEKKNLDVYGYKHIFDFVTYADMDDENLRFIANNPFIYRRIITNKEIGLENSDKNTNCISFYDALGFFGCSLNQAAKTIKKQKIEYNLNINKLEQLYELVKSNDINNKDINEIVEYNRIDAELVMDLLLNLKKVLKENGFNPKNLISVGQIAANYVFNEIKKLPKEEYGYNIFKDQFNSKTIQPKKEFMNLQTYACRGGRFDAFKVGYFDNATEIDLNSAYSFADINIRFPNLKTFKYINEPLNGYIELNELIKYIGISKVVLSIQNNNKIGIVPVRFKGQQVFPDNKNMIIIGSYTHQELEYFIQKGYNIEHVFYSMIYTKEIKNPFKLIIPKIYELRKLGKFENMLFKRVLNFTTGKMNQKRQKKELRFVNRLDAYKYEMEGWKKINATTNKYLIEKKSEQIEYGKFFIGQVYADITAKIRLEIAKLIDIIDKEDLIYIACDAIIINNFDKYKNKIKLSNEIGCFKIEEDNIKGYVYSKQQYVIGDKVKASGVKDAILQKDNFLKGTIKATRMVDLRSDPTNFGIIKEEIRDLSKTTEKLLKIKKELNELWFIVDQEEFDEKVLKWYKNNVLFIDKFKKNVIKGNQI